MSGYDLDKIVEAIKPDIESGKIFIYPNEGEIIKDIQKKLQITGHGDKYIRFFIVTDREHYKEEKKYYDDIILKNDLIMGERNNG